MNEPIESFALLAHVEKIIEDRFDKHELEKRPLLNEINDRLVNLEKLIKDGFPHGDPSAHRRVHERYIEEANERYKMVASAKQKVVEMTLWGALVILAAALWDYFKAHVN